MKRLGGLLFLAAVAGLGSSRAAAQTDPRLVAAVRDAQEGRADSARAAVRQLLAATATGDSLYPQLLYTAAITAADVTERERALQRIVVEYPVSPWTDDALLLLAQSDYAGGNLPGAVRDLERIREDFPVSPVLPRASVWAARTYFEMRNQAAACGWVALGLARAGEDVESRDQLTFQSQRCGKLPQVAAAPSQDASASSQAARQGGATTPATIAPATIAPSPIAPAPIAADTAATSIADTARGSAQAARTDSVPAAPANTPPSAVPPPAVPPSGVPQPAARPFRIQLAAAASQAEADAIVRSLRTRGIDADVTADKGYFKVRSGEYRTAAEAQRELVRIRTRLGGTPFVVRP